MNPQGKRDPYAVWVSEIMLQQTQVATVVPFFERWMRRFPTLQSLADAPLDEVLPFWAGLGYYARVRNLHRAAQEVMQHHDGELPQTAEALRALPGIGAYTAGAIASLAFEQSEPLVDANVERVLARVFAVEGDITSSAVKRKIWEIAAQEIPAKSETPGPGEFNEALMELGALVCRPADPRCGRCPLKTYCKAQQSGDPSRLPELPPGRAPVTQNDVCIAVRDSMNRLLLGKRPLAGLWGGLWELPRMVAEGGEAPEEAARRAAEAVGLTEFYIGDMLASVRHGVTFRKIRLDAFSVTNWQGTPEADPGLYTELRFLPDPDLQGMALASPQRELVLKLAARQLGRSQDGQQALCFDPLDG